MIVLYILGGLLALIIILLCVPFQLLAVYDEKLELTIKYFFIPLQIMPRKKHVSKPKSKFVLWAGEKWKNLCRWFIKLKSKIRKKKQPSADIKKKKKSETKQKNSFALLREQRGFGGMLALLWRVLTLATGAFRGILRMIVVEKFDFHAEIGGKDAADAAVNYGEMCSVLFPALAFILGSTRKYKKDIVINPNFESDETTVEIDAVIRIVPLFVVFQAIKALVKLVWLEIKDKINEAVSEAKNNISHQGGVING